MTPTLAERLSGDPFMLLLDIDGTLAPIAGRPSDAVVPPETRRVLEDLARTPGVQVVAISGRSAMDSRRLICLDDTWIIGNHGIEVAPPMGPPVARSEVKPYAEQVAAAAVRADAIAQRIPGVIVEDKLWTLSVHYRLVRRDIVPELTKEVTAIAAELGLRVTMGKEVLELRPPVGINKGTAAVDLAATLGALDYTASLLCAGDDRTDEDMFREVRRAQPRCVTVQVGDEAIGPATSAEFALPDPEAMRVLLEEILSLRRDRS
ncbi:MAG: trehalose-phosphatase [Myxococcales bacterium]